MAAFRSVKSAAPSRRASVVWPLASMSKNSIAMTQVWGSFTSVANGELERRHPVDGSPVPNSESVFQRSPPSALSDLPDDEQEDEHGQEADERPEPPAPLRSSRAGRRRPPPSAPDGHRHAGTSRPPGRRSPGPRR